MDKGSCLGPRRSPKQTRSPQPASQPGNPELSASRSTPFPAPAPAPLPAPAHPAQPMPSHRQPDRQAEGALLPPCQLTRPVIDAPNLEAPCPFFTGYSRGSVRRRLARGLIDGTGWDVRAPLPLTPCVHAAVNEEERKKNREGQSGPLGRSQAPSQLLSYKHSGFQTFFPALDVLVPLPFFRSLQLDAISTTHSCSPPHLFRIGSSECACAAPSLSV